MESRRIESLIAFEGFFYSFRAQPPFWLHGAFVVKTKGVNLLGNGGRRRPSGQLILTGVLEMDSIVFKQFICVFDFAAAPPGPAGLSQC